MREPLYSPFQESPDSESPFTSEFLESAADERPDENFSPGFGSATGGAEEQPAETESNDRYLETTEEFAETPAEEDFGEYYSADEAEDELAEASWQPEAAGSEWEDEAGIEGGTNRGTDEADQPEVLELLEYDLENGTNLEDSETIMADSLEVSFRPQEYSLQLESRATKKPKFVCYRSTHLSWPQGTAVQKRFMRRVYVAQAAHSAVVGRRPFYLPIPAGELAVVEDKQLLRLNAAKNCRTMLAELRKKLILMKKAGDPGAVRADFIKAFSGYRSTHEQFLIWQKKFPLHYANTMAARRKLTGGEHGRAAVSYMRRFMSQNIAAPGYSIHNNGLAMDFVISQGGKFVRNSTGKQYTDVWRGTWFWKWLTANATRYGFYQNQAIDEPWHWEYRSA